MTSDQRTKRKLPSDYPQMIFRVSKTDKRKLTALIAEIKRLANRGRKPQDRVTKKNDITVSALYRGLIEEKNRLTKRHERR